MNADRKKHVLERKIGLQQGVGGIDQEIGIFEIGERQQIADDAKGQQPGPKIGPAGATLGGHCSGNQEIEDSQAAEQRNVERVPPAVEQQRDRYQQSQHSARTGQLPQQDVGGHRPRQKEEQEDRRIKQHLRN